MSEGFIRVATDGDGKRVAMEQQKLADGTTDVYIQKALLVGDPADALAQLLESNQAQLAVLRAILAILRETSNARITEEDFSAQKGANFDV